MTPGGEAAHTGPAGCRVTVIVPAYDAEDYVARAVRSALRSGPEGTEVVVVDDGSRDGTSDVVEAIRRGRDGGEEGARVRLVRHDENRGKAEAVNTGLREARGEHIGVLDADDEYEYGGLRSLYDASRRLPDGRGMVIGGVRVVDASGATVGHRPAPGVADAERLRRRVAFAWKTPFHFNASLVSAALYREAGAFPGDVGRVVDIDMSLHLLRSAGTIHLVERPVYRYRKHRMTPGARAAVRLRTIRGRYRVLRRHFPGPAGFAGAVWMGMLDGMKLVFELFGNYSA